MSDLLRVRAATLDDIPAVSAIERDSFRDPWSERSLRSVLDVAHMRFFVAAGFAVSGPTPVQAPKIKGFIIIVMAGDEAEVADFAVCSDSRRTGVGQLLLDHALIETETLGIRAMYLEVRESNAAAIGLYLSRGFTRVGVRKRYYQAPVESALVLRAALHNELASGIT